MVSLVFLTDRLTAHEPTRTRGGRYVATREQRLPLPSFPLPIEMGESARRADLLETNPGVRPGVRIPLKISRIEPLNRSAAFTPLQCAKFLQYRKLKRRERRAPSAGFMGRVDFICRSGVSSILADSIVLKFWCISGGNDDESAKSIDEHYE